MLDFTKQYKCEDFPGVAVYPVGYITRYDDVTGDDVEDTDLVYVIMVGDDRKNLVHVDTLTEVNEQEYCGGCGQVGCGWTIGED